MMMRSESAIVRDRIEALSLLVEQDVEMVVPELSSSFWERALKPWLGRIGRVFARFVPSNAISNSAAKLEKAGSPWRLKPLDFIGVKILAVLLFALLAVGSWFLLDLSIAYKIAIAAVIAVAGFLLPNALLDHAAEERQRKIRKSLSDCLDLLVVCTEAGLGLDGAIAKVVERMPGPLSEEFRRVLQDLSIGRSRMEALKAMSERIGIPEFTTFIAAVRQSEQLGVSIAQVLRVQTESLRSTRNARARETAAKLPVKMMFPLVLFIFPTVLAVILGPGMIDIYRAIVSR
jgi:tight adherence protein C